MFIGVCMFVLVGYLRNQNIGLLCDISWVNSFCGEFVDHLNVLKKKRINNLQK